MNDKHPLVPIEGTSDRYEPLMQVPASEERSSQPLRKVHSIMRGRYKLAILLGGLLAAACGLGGFRLTQPIYRSYGTISIKPVLPKVLYPSERSTLMPMFEAYVGTQVELLQNSRVIYAAIDDPDYKKLQLPSTPDVLDKFSTNLHVDHPRNSEIIFVYYDDPDPKVAKQTVTSVINAYSSLYGNADEQSMTASLNELDTRRTRLQNEFNSIVKQEQSIASEYGGQSLDTIYQMKLADLAKLEQQIRELQIAVQMASPKTAAGGKADGAAAKPGDAKAGAAGADGKDAPAAADTPVGALSPEDIAARGDAQMRAYLQQREGAKRQLEQLTISLGPNHREVIQARTLLASIEQTIQQYAAQVNARLNQIGSDPTAPGGKGYSLAQLKERLKATQELYDKTKTEAVDLGKKNMQLASLKSEEETKRQNLKQTEERIDQLKTESSVHGRINVVSHGDDARVARDRRQGLAAAGALFGGGLGFGIVLLIGSMDRRLRSLDDAQDTLGRLTMLGILPRLPDDLAEPEHAAVAAHCVHQIRTLLQIGSDAQGRRVFTVTSPGAQDGKTSLSLALGVSFAAAGSKTLLVDCDLIGGGLTLRVDSIIRRKIGQILLREQLVTQQQVDEALQLAQESNRRLGETLIELGYLAQESLDAALNLQEQTPVGLLDALDGEPLEECVGATGIRSLDILPIGGAESYDVCKVSPTAVRRLLEEARSQYDVIVVDTGPVPGSLEASHICAESDGVIMVVARGEQRKLAEKSVEHLYAIGARVLGLVFNRAEGTDVQVLSASLSDALSEVQGMDDDGNGTRTPTRLNVSNVESNETARFDPVARAVASSSQSNRTNGSK